MAPYFYLYIKYLAMRKNLPLLIILFISFITTSSIKAQVADRFAYAVTDAGQGPNWNFLRKLDLQSGVYTDILLNGNDIKQIAYDASSKKVIASFPAGKGMGFNEQPAFSSGVAAMAYDRKNNRLYYTPMFIDQLRYIDLKTMKVFYVTDHVFSGRAQKSPDQGNIITRMVIADDGNGYAITNDGTQLLRFSTGKKLNIEDLGTLVDAPANKGVSIHNSCSSFGGDVVADDDGGLYVFSARNQIFRIDLETKVATHLGAINGLPNGFTTNGAAVTTENKIVVSTAMSAASYYTVDLKSLIAVPYTVQGTVWQSSDLANSNLYVTGNRGGTVTTTETGKGAIPVATGDGKIAVYPNPVTNNQFAIQFNELKAGNYTVQVTDVMGQQVLQQSVSLGGDNQTQLIRMDRSAAKGMYLVKVIDTDSKLVYTTKIILQ
jgi:hypothetical protein